MSIRLFRGHFITLRCAAAATVISVSLLASFTVPAQAARARVYTVPTDVVNDCSAAVDSVLNTWIASVPNYSTLRFLPGACYGLDTGLLVTDRTSLTIDGRGATFKAITQGTSNRRNWTIQSGRNITLKNMTARGFNPDGGVGSATVVNGVSYEWQHLYSFEGTHGGMLDNVQGYDAYGDMVEAMFDSRFWDFELPARNITVQNSHFERNGRQGVGATDVDGFVFRNNYMGDIAQAGIDLEPDVATEYARNVLITGNTFQKIWFSTVSISGWIGDGRVGNITITNNSSVGPFRVGEESCRPPVYVDPGNSTSTVANLAIKNNRFIAYGYAYELRGVTNATISGNNDTFANGGCDTTTAVKLTDVHNVTIRNNTFQAFPGISSADSVSTGVTTCMNRLSLTASYAPACPVGRWWQPAIP